MAKKEWGQGRKETKNGDEGTRQKQGPVATRTTRTGHGPAADQRKNPGERESIKEISEPPPPPE